MSQVKGYVRTVNGRPVKVRSYQQTDGEQNIAAGILNRPPLSARSGQYTHGLVPVALFPAGRSVPGQLLVTWQRSNPEANTPNLPGLTNLSDDLIALANAATEWTDAVTEAVAHISLVLKNNPKTPLAEIVARPDVQQALRDAGTQGADAAARAIAETWAENGGSSDSIFLHMILADMDRNGRSFAPRMTQAMANGDVEDMQAIAVRDRFRAAAAQSVALTRARTEAAIAQMKKAGVTHIKWVANFKNNTPCKECAALHNTIIPIGLEFPYNLSGLNVKVYHNLIGPPRHPNCRCKVVVSK